MVLKFGVPVPLMRSEDMFFKVPLAYRNVPSTFSNANLAIPLLIFFVSLYACHALIKHIENVFPVEVLISCACFITFDLKVLVVVSMYLGLLLDINR
jgi:hypothetical protein